LIDIFLKISKINFFLVGNINAVIISPIANKCIYDNNIKYEKNAIL